MQIQVNTGHHVEGGEELTRQIEGVVEGALGRFSDRITRVEVHLTDENGSQKSSRCDRLIAPNRKLIICVTWWKQHSTHSSNVGTIRHASTHHQMPLLPSRSRLHDRTD